MGIARNYGVEHPAVGDTIAVSGMYRKVNYSTSKLVTSMDGGNAERLSGAISVHYHHHPVRFETDRFATK